MSDDVLEQFYREHLEEDIVLYLSRKRNISNIEALGLYYNSKLADSIHEGKFGLQYLDYHVLTECLEEELRECK